MAYARINEAYFTSHEERKRTIAILRNDIE